MTRATAAAFAGLANLLSAGCASRSPVYRIDPQARVLLPPNAGKPASITLPVPVARCSVSNPHFDLRVRGRTARFRIRQPGDRPGWLATWVAEKSPATCLDSHIAYALALQLAEDLPTALGPRLHPLRSRPADSAYEELYPGDRVRVVAPVLRPGTSGSAIASEPPRISAAGTSLNVDLKASSNLLGVAVSWYTLRAKQPEGASIVFESAEVQAGGSGDPPPPPPPPLLRFSPDLNYYRLFYLSRLGRDRELAVLAAASLEDLIRYTALVEADPEACARLSSKGNCFAADPQVAIARFISVQIQGRAVDLRPGTTVGAAIREQLGGDPARVLAALQVLKLYRGQPAQVRFDPRQPAVLDLPLEGGERITW